MQQFFPVAAWYMPGRSRAPMVVPEKDPERTRREIHSIKEAGFNTVRAWIDWVSAEPVPGEFHLEPLMQVLKLAEEEGLKVIVQIYLDSAPDWIVAEYPDAGYVTQSGHRLESQGSPGYCYDHPGVRRRAEIVLTKIAQTVSSSPVFLAWDIWSEPHVTNWAYLDYLKGPVTFCYCDHTVKRFQEWLRKKYGTIEELNRIWYRAFGSFDAIRPPRYPTIHNCSDLVDWQVFLMEKIREDLAWRASVVKAVDPDHPVATHVGSPAIYNLPLSHHGNPDDWTSARSVDIWGTSVYPAHYVTGEPWGPIERGAVMDATRGAADAAEKPYWLGELQGGQGYVGMLASRPVEPEDEILWGWEAIGHGAKGICYYAYNPMSRGFESAGFGMVRLDGTDTGRAAAAGSVGRVVTRNMELLLKARPHQAEVAILYDVYSNVLWTAMREYDEEVPRRSMLGYYRAFTSAGIPVDFIHVSSLESGDLSQYKVVYIPFGMMLPSGAAKGLIDYVARGGRVVADARLGWNDEHGRCDIGVPGFGLEEVFGCREIYTRCNDPKVQIADGLTWDGFYYEQALELTSSSARPLATFPAVGKIAATINGYGQGSAILIGTLTSAAYETTRDERLAQWIRGFAEELGVAAPVQLEKETPEGDPHAYVLETPCGNARIVVLTNPATTPCQVTATFAGRGKNRVVELIRDEEIEAEAEADGFVRVRQSLEPKGVAALVIS